jgi:hypothetical protein
MEKKIAAGLNIADGTAQRRLLRFKTAYSPKPTSWGSSVITTAHRMKRISFTVSK